MYHTLFQLPNHNPDVLTEPSSQSSIAKQCQVSLPLLLIALPLPHSLLPRLLSTGFLSHTVGRIISGAQLTDVLKNFP
jgi:hypothetical protein